MDNTINNVFLGKNYRITVLTERLLRLEYNESGVFCDNLTEFVTNRNFPIPKFEVQETEKILMIATKYFHLTYKKNMPFKGNKINPASHLKVELINTNKTWYYGHPEIRNYGGVKPSFNSEIKTMKGLYSIDGFSSFDDSKTKVIGNSGAYEERESSKDSIDIYLFMYRNDYDLALKDYFTLTGYPELIPRYALGVWWSRDYKYTDQELIKLVETFEEKKIPLSVLLLDKYWHERKLDDNKLDDSKYTFNDLYIKNVDNLINYMNNHNVRLGLNIKLDSGIKYENKFGDENLIPYNVLDVNFIKTMLSEISFKYRNMGINVLWVDYRKNVRDLAMLNRYLMITNDIRENRPLILSRGNTIAPHRDNIIYTGRIKVGYETLSKMPYFTSRAANLGVSWISHDIAGYTGGIEDDELYIRCVQLGVFSPILRFHGGNSKYYRKEPWNRSISTYHIVKDYLNLRQKLIPYIYTEGYNYVNKCIPVIRPLYYTNNEIYDEPEYMSEYYFGSQMLISPITYKRDYLIKRAIHKFFLPDGVWYDLKTGKKYIGNDRHIGLYKKEEYPVFVKAGGIIPLSESKNVDDLSELTIMIFPGRNNRYELYEDDGNTGLYKQGMYTKTSIEYMFSNEEINITIKPIEGRLDVIPRYRKYNLILRNTSKPYQVICNLSGNDINNEYSINGSDLEISINSVDTSGTLSIKITGQSLEKSPIDKVSEDLEHTISDLPIETPLKDRISNIIFSDKDIKNKRVEIIKLKKLIPKNYYQLILKLLNYMYNN